MLHKMSADILQYLRETPVAVEVIAWTFTLLLAGVLVRVVMGKQIRERKRYVQYNRKIEQNIDASIKAGLLDSTVMELVRINETRDCAVVNKAKTILSCIQQHQERLICNRGDFINCAYDFGLTDGVVPILSGKKNQIEKKLYFPHSSDCKIVWSNDGLRYAVLRE